MHFVLVYGSNLQSSFALFKLGREDDLLLDKFPQFCCFVFGKS